MILSPRRLSLAPRRWAMSLLAWLMLVLNTAHALPMVGMGAMATGPAAMTAMMTSHEAAAAHAMPPASPHCDGGAGMADGGCHCPTMCAPALLPVPALTVALQLSPVALAPRPVDTAPRRPASPPLRPPQG